MSAFERAAAKPYLVTIEITKVGRMWIAKLRFEHAPHVIGQYGESPEAALEAALELDESSDRKPPAGAWGRRS